MSLSGESTYAPDERDTIAIPPRDQRQIALLAESRFRLRASPSRNPRRGCRASTVQRPASGTTRSSTCQLLSTSFAGRLIGSMPAAGIGQHQRHLLGRQRIERAGHDENRHRDRAGTARRDCTTSAIAFSPWIWTAGGHRRLDGQHPRRRREAPERDDRQIAHGQDDFDADHRAQAALQLPCQSAERRLGQPPAIVRMASANSAARIDELGKQHDGRNSSRNERLRRLDLDDGEHAAGHRPAPRPGYGNAAAKIARAPRCVRCPSAASSEASGIERAQPSRRCRRHAGIRPAASASVARHRRHGRSRQAPGRRRAAQAQGERPRQTPSTVRLDRRRSPRAAPAVATITVLP